jgi:excisionase family DNA binding protein
MQYLSISQAAARLSVSKDTIRRAIKDGRLPAFMVVGRWRIAADDLERLKVHRYQ